VRARPQHQAHRAPFSGINLAHNLFQREHSALGRHQAHSLLAPFVRDPVARRAPFLPLRSRVTVETRRRFSARNESLFQARTRLVERGGNVLAREFAAQLRGYLDGR
jgi:hypothetical protein